MKTLAGKGYKIYEIDARKRMTVCCRCNGDGKCKNCVCVKAGKTCTTCLPARRGNCSNMRQPPGPDSAPVRHPTPNEQPPPAVDPVTSRSTANSPQPTTETSLPMLPAVTTSAVPVAASQATPLQPRLTPSNAHLLPPPQLLTSSTFKWGDYDSSSYSTSLFCAIRTSCTGERTPSRYHRGKEANCLCRS